MRAAGLLAAALLAVAPAPTEAIVVRFIDDPFGQGPDPSTVGYPTTVVGGVRRPYLPGTVLAGETVPLLFGPLTTAAGETHSVEFSIPERLRGRPLCLTAVAVGDGPGEQQVPVFTAAAGTRERMPIRVHHPTAAGTAVVLVRGAPPRRSVYESQPFPVARGTRLDFAAAIIPAAKTTPTLGVAKALAEALRRGGDLPGAIYEEAPGLMPVRFSVTVVPEPAKPGATPPPERHVFDERFDPGDGPTTAQWEDRSVDLGAWAGSRVRLRLQAEDCPAAQVPAWGDPTVSTPTAKPPYNVLLVSIDTLRADGLGCYGSRRRTSPELDRVLAGSGTLFEHAYAAFPETAGSHMTVLTSLPPCVHGVTRTGSRIAPGLHLLTEHLRAHGYDTGGFVEGVQVISLLGFARGCSTWLEYNGMFSRESINQTVDHAATWIRTRARRPWFAFVHTYHVHWPYNPTVGDLDRVVDACSDRSSYEAEIRYMDDVIAGFLRALPDPDHTLVVFLSDHGEQFGEHGLTQHANSLYTQLLHVPLVLRAPGLVPAGRRIAMPVSLLDVAPTILDLVGLPIPEAMQGRSLVPLLRGGTLPARTLFAEKDTGWTPRPLLAAHLPDLKVILDPDSGDFEAFALASDPEETFDLAPEVPRALVEQLLFQHRSTCRTAVAPIPVPAEEIGPEVREQLRALGYVN